MIKRAKFRLTQEALREMLGLDLLDISIRGARWDEWSLTIELILEGNGLPDGTQINEGTDPVPVDADVIVHRLYRIIKLEVSKVSND